MNECVFFQCVFFFKINQNLLDGVSGLVQADFTKLAAVDATAAELNIMDGGTSATSTTLADADRVVVNDNGTMWLLRMKKLARCHNALLKRPASFLNQELLYVERSTRLAIICF